jgi:AbrB family looped-hinge helix DNA binding protein
MPQGGAMQRTSTITSKGQTTLPREVREALSLKPGDQVVYEIEAGAVMIRKLAPLDAAYMRALQTTLSEWNSPEDAEAYDDL